MFSVALIGPDGAGKTTIGRMLTAAAPFPMRYLYMGINTQASNHALPSSRLIEYVRERRARTRVRPCAEAAAQRTAGRLPAVLWAAARLLNRFADEWYRQVVSWVYQARGNVVLYDRHFSLDFSLPGVNEHEPFDSRWHRWLLKRCYPQPDLIVYLDAPAGVLFARKGEKSVEDLERRRQAFLRQRNGRNFVIVDATQPLPVVCAQVLGHIASFYASRIAGRAFTQLESPR